MKCTEVIARVLQAEGVELMTCFPLNPVIDAAALGGHGERIEKVADLKPALQRAIAVTEAGRPAFLEIITAEEPDFPCGK